MWSFDVYASCGSAAPAQQWMRGRTLGGSSCINGMIYYAGQPRDYDDMAALTSDDWNWAHMSAAFKAIEGHNLAPTPTRGTEGPLKVTTYPGDGGEETLMKAAIASGEALGLEHQEDVNEPDHQAKIGYTVRTIYRGRRQSAAVAFLRAGGEAANLVIRTGVLADRVIFEGTRAVAVECRWGSEPTRFHGNRIIVSAGTLASPAILQRSGIGSPELLAHARESPVVAASPEVGENMIEHTIINSAVARQGLLQQSALPGHRRHLERDAVLPHPLRAAGQRDARGDRSFQDTSRCGPARGQIHFGPHSFADRRRRTRSPEKHPGFMLARFRFAPARRGRCGSSPGIRPSSRR